MNRTDFINEINSHYPTSKLHAVKLIKDVSGLGLRESKDLADIHFTSESWGHRVAEILERQYNIVFTTKIVDKVSLGLEFTKLQLRAKEADLEKYFQYLCESTVDESFSNTVEENKVQEDKTDEVIH